MPKLFIQWRKKWFLPLKYRFIKKKISDNLSIRTKEEIEAKLKELSDQKLRLERLRRFPEVEMTVKQIELLNWVLCQEENPSKQ
jgi:hypothetical protein